MTTGRYAKLPFWGLLRKALDDDQTIAEAIAAGAGGSFVGLSDTPGSYSGQAQKHLKVNAGEDALEFVTLAGGGDMLKSTYDTGENGIVDNSEKLEGSTKAQVQDHTPKAHTLGSHSTKAHSELTGVTAAQHHAKYLDSEAVAAVKAGVKLNELQNPTGAVAMNSQRLSGLGAVTTQGDGIPADANLRAPNASQLEGSNKAAVQNHAVTVGNLPANSKIRNIEIIIDGGGEAITTGIKGDVEISFACTINQVTLLADVSGSIKVDIWKDTYANYPPDNADSICASAEPEISAALKYQDSTLSGWTTSITAGDILRFNVDSCATIKRVTLSLKVTIT